MQTKKKKNLIELVTEFIKLQLAGYIPFWGKYLGFAFFDHFTTIGEFYSLLIPTIAANIVFFIIDDRWVFIHKGRTHKTTPEAIRFIIFITFSEMIVFSMTISMATYLHLTPYLGQFISGFLMALWTFFGLRFWVFADEKIPAKHRTRHATHAKSRRKSASRRRPASATER